MYLGVYADQYTVEIIIKKLSDATSLEPRCKYWLCERRDKVLSRRFSFVMKKYAKLCYYLRRCPNLLTPQIEYVRDFRFPWLDILAISSMSIKTLNFLKRLKERNNYVELV